MKTKPKTPYQRILEDIKEFCHKVRYRHQKTMWTYPKNLLGEAWAMGSLYERTMAAEQLGYEVHLIANSEGLTVIYKKHVPNIPFAWR